MASGMFMGRLCYTECMIAPRNYVSYDRSIGYAITILMALTAMKFGLPDVCVGLFFGVFISLGAVIETEGDDMPLGVAIAVIVLGVVLWATAAVLSQQHGVPMGEFRTVRDLSRFMRGTPYLGTWCVVAGSFLVLAYLIGTRDAPAQE